MHDILNTLLDQIVLLDQSAIILETNHSWENTHPNTTGLNFLQVCETKTQNANIKEIREAIQQITIGKCYEYSCSLLIDTQNYSMLLTPILLDNILNVMVSLRNITDTNAVKVDVHNYEQQINQLTETNIALHALLKSREHDRATLEGAIATNVNQLIMPYITRLEESNLAPENHTLVHIVKEYLNNIISPFLHRISTINQQLTPQELKVASLIRQGHSSKEIGKALNLSVNGVGFHRKSIRSKLGLTGSGKNLRSQLMSLRD